MAKLGAYSCDSCVLLLPSQPQVELLTKMHAKCKINKKIKTTQLAFYNKKMQNTKLIANEETIKNDNYWLPLI